MRILLLIAIGFMAYIIIKQLLDGRLAKRKHEDEATAESVDLVKCGYCGIHVVASEAIESGEDRAAYYCSVEHQTLDMGKHG